MATATGPGYRGQRPVSRKDGIGSRIKGAAPLRAPGRRAVAALDAREHGDGGRPRAQAGAWALSRLRLLETVPEEELLALERGVDVRALG